MKTSIKIIIKLCVFLYVLMLSPFFNEIFTNFIHTNVFMTSSIYESDFEQQISIKDQLNLMKISDNVTLSENINITSGKYIDNTSKNNNIISPNTSHKKKVYIYNTHQQEGYYNNKTVVDGSIELANLLQEANIEVVYESNDFSKYLKQNGLNYNDSYQASYYYLNEALVNYSGFDLVIDYHRDSVPRDNTYIIKDDKKYAKMMFVVGGLSPNKDHIITISNTLANLVSKRKDEVMKKTMMRESYYNQEVYKNMILVEVGSDTNYYDEISNSTKLLSEAIIEYLR